MSCTKDHWTSRTRAGAVAAAAAVLAAAPSLAQDHAALDEFIADADHRWEMLQTYCVECHNFEDWAGGVAFDTMRPDGVPEEAEVWEAVLTKLHGRLMPPPGETQPDQERIDDFIGWMEAYLDNASEGRRVGHVPIQRMNASQYAASVEALLGVELDAATILPTEVEVDGFDNIASALGVSPAFLDQYIAAARLAADLAVGDAEAKTANVQFVSPGGAQAVHTDGMPLGTRGGVVFPHVFPADGEYRFTILDLDVGLYPRAAESRHTLLLLIDGDEVFRADIGGPEDLAMVDRDSVSGRATIMERFADIPVDVTAGPHDIAIAFIERARVLTEDPIAPRDTGANFGAGLGRLPHVIGAVEVDGPFNIAGVSETESRRLLFTCYPESAAEESACAEEVIANLARRAFRRPVTEDDLAVLMPFYENARADGATFDTGIEHAVTAVLASPDFLYRAIEPPQAAEAEGDGEPPLLYALSDLELASRLSFFVWSQGPDDELIELAASGALSEPDVLEAQVKRMLDDPRASVLVSDFAMKWLNLDDLDGVDPNGPAAEGYSERLRDDFAEEAELFMASILLEDRSILDLLSADHTFVNEALAAHYGIPGVRGDQFRRVTLEDEARWGLLGKAAVLMRTSYGDRTSPVLRGAWILEKILGTPPSPPPPNVDTDLSVPEGQRPTTLRARLEAHRADQNCNACHGVIDPWGLALENFTVTGRWRDYDFAADEEIDAATVLSNGAAAEGPQELREELMRNGEQVVRNFTAKLMMYALGRELEFYDMPEVRRIAREAAADDYALSAIVLGIVNSDAFRYQAAPEYAEALAHGDTRVQ